MSQTPGEETAAEMSTANRRILVEPVRIIKRVLHSLEYESTRKIEGDIVARMHARFDVPKCPTLAAQATGAMSVLNRIRAMSPWLTA